MNQKIPTALKESSLSLDTLDSKLDIVGHWVLLKSEKTRKSYRTELIKFFKFIGLQRDLRFVTTLDISNYLSGKKSSGASNATLARIKATLSSFFTFLEKIEAIPKNPVRAIDKIKVDDQTVRRVLSIEEINYMIEKEPNQRNKLIINTFIKTGVRLSELCGLTYNSILKRDDKFLMIILGKGNKTRSFGISEDLFLSLVKLKKSTDPQEPVFKKQKSKSLLPLSPGAVSKIIKMAAIRVGLPKEVSPHWLRHSFGAYANSMGIDLRTIQHILGHGSSSVTDKYTKFIKAPRSIFN